MTSITLVTNPISGCGRSLQVCSALQSSLAEAGHAVTLVESSLEPVKSWLDPVLQDADLVLAAGGDGTVRMVAESACRTDTPLHQVPMGTGNLFARTLGMRADLDSIIEAIDAWHIERLDAFDVGGTHGQLVASCGFDAAVVSDLTAHRSGPISNWTFLPIMLRQLARWRPVSTRVVADEQVVSENHTGLCLVCNSLAYLRSSFDPALDRSMQDGLLDVVLLPTRSRIGVLRWILKAMHGRHLKDKRAIHVQARSIALSFDSPVLWQLDGESPPGEASIERLHVQITPESLPVLMPVDQQAEEC